MNAADLASLDDVLARNFRSYAVDGMRTRTGMKVLGDGAVFDPEEVGRHEIHRAAALSSSTRVVPTATDCRA